jgi:hypothetical protein
MNSKESSFFSPIYETLPIGNLRKMFLIEIFLIFITGIELCITGLTYYFITNIGIISLQPIVYIDQILWPKSIEQAYYLVWVEIAVLIIEIIIRKKFHDLTKIPITLKNELNEDQIEQKNESQLTSELNQGETTLRNHKLYYFAALFGIALMIGYLNYFPRTFGLFSSYKSISEQFATIQDSTEFTIFILINIVWSFSLAMIFLFMLFFSARQIKDINNTIKIRVKSGENLDQPIESWKPQLSKPWNLMTIEEQKQYRLEVLALEKERSIQSKEDQFKKLVETEREKRRLGEKAYSLKQKEAKQKTKSAKKEKLEKSKVKEDKFDFR